MALNGKPISLSVTRLGRARICIFLAQLSSFPHTQWHIVHCVFLCSVLIWCLGQDNSVGVASSYGLDGRGIDARYGRGYLYLSRPARGAHSAAYAIRTWNLSPGVNRPGRGVHHPLQSSTEVKERVELYLYYPSRTSWSFIGWTLPNLMQNFNHKPFQTI